MSKKTCFVVSPIGDRGSEVRRRADCVLEYIVKPALAELGYEKPVRVDSLDKPTHITTEIVQQLITADLVIADLSGANANVFYELGIRHAHKKPCIMLSNWDPSPPFDVGGTNIIRYIHDDPSSHAEAIKRIQNQVGQFVDGSPVSNPVTVANGFTELENSGDDKDHLLVALSKQVAALGGQVRLLTQQAAYPTLNLGRVGSNSGVFPSAIQTSELLGLKVSSTAATGFGEAGLGDIDDSGVK